MDWEWGEFAEAVRYSSDEDNLNGDLLPSADLNESDPKPSFSAVPPCKRQKIDVPYPVQVAQKSDTHRQKHTAQVAAWQEALVDIQNLFRSK